jgi:RNA polymerase sigma-70 factor (ECF subfamily)
VAVCDSAAISYTWAVDLEAELRRRFDAGDLAGVATAALEGYGGELFGFLVGLARDVDQAGEAFARFCEEMWRDLPRFRWESSFRTWAYVVARHQLYRTGEERARQAAQVPVSQAPELRALAEKIKTTTLGYLRSEVKDEFTRLREQLDPDDRVLLVLRVDRDMAWKEIAQVLDVREETLRKRFERIKDRLRELARAAGLMDP